MLLEETGTRAGKRMELAGEGSGQTREGAREVDTSLYTRKMNVNQGGEWKDSGDRENGAKQARKEPRVRARFQHVCRRYRFSVRGGNIQY